MTVDLHLQALYRTATSTSPADDAIAATSLRFLQDRDTYEMAALEAAWGPALAAALHDCLG